MTRVVVAGAGISGLTLGIALARAGVTVDLHERADEANQSIEDAVVLARLLVEHDLETALAAYTRRRRARTRAIAASAWDTGTLLHLADDHPRLAERDRRFAGYLPANAWVHDHDAEDLTATGGRTR